MVCLDTENGFISLSGSSIILIIKFNIYLHLVSPFWIDIYIYINIMRGKKDVTTFPDKPVS